MEPGQVVAIVGASGSGKSTIVNLLLRFYDFKSGNGLLILPRKKCYALQIKIDNTDISAYNIHELRNIVGVVSQEPILFDATIEDNLRYSF